MENFLSIGQSVKSRLQKPRVYALTLERPGVGQSVSCVLAFDLEEAVVKAKEVLMTSCKMTAEEAHQWKLNLFVRKSLEEVVAEATDLSIQEAKVVPNVMISEKNMLMQKIIDTKDAALLRRSKKQFTETEVKYLTERLALPKS